MITGDCHCGQVSFSLREEPAKLVRCNCSACRRLGALWGHLEIVDVTIDAPEGGTIAYAYGDRNLAFHSCSNCGCTTHWENLKPDQTSHMAVNFNLCEPSVVARFRIRNFDGADTWEFLD